MAFKEEIDNYTDTIYAIVGFMNFYRFDRKKHQFRNDVKFLQGKKLFPTEGDSEYLTPDIGIVKPENVGVVGEVKHTLPRNKELWEQSFEQLIKYDENLIGWPTENSKIDEHDIVLLVHSIISRGVVNYITSNSELYTFKRPFSIVEYSRIEQEKSKMFFRRELGKISDNEVNSILEEGVPVPMDVFYTEYSMIKIYDAEPPLPYIINLLWESLVFVKASSSPDFRILRKNQKIEVEFTLDEMVNELNRKYSFYSLCNHGEDNQIKIPKKEWIKNACEKIVSFGEARWKDSSKQSVIFDFRKYENVLEHFISKCESELESQQPLLFNPEEIDNSPDLPSA